MTVQDRHGGSETTTALVVVDVQNDFCSGGVLAIPDADAVISVVNELSDTFEETVFTQDWHPRGHVSFASSHPGYRPFDSIELPCGRQMLWPDHCIEDTHGAAFHPRLRIPSAAHVVRKGCRPQVDSYSAFFENDRITPVGLDDWLRQRRIGAVVLAGLATDVCVLATALDARRLGYEVSVFDAGCRALDRDGSLADAWIRMTHAGVRRI